MSELQTIRRITVYADSAVETTLLEQFLKLGATGYTVVECRGKGEHDSVADPFGASTRVRIEILVQPAVADKIVDYLQTHHHRGHALTACVETVQGLLKQHY
jgi:nitrogen regulatory protein PII